MPSLSLAKLYVRYKEGGGVAGYLVSLRVALEQHIQKPKHDDFDFFTCTYCYKSEEQLQHLHTRILQLKSLGEVSGNLMEEQQMELLGAKVDALELETHVRMNHHQQGAFTFTRENLHKGQMVMCMDFGQHAVQMVEGAYADLVLTFYWLDDAGRECREYIDCLASEMDELKRKKTWNVVVTALLSLADGGKFNDVQELFIFSDTGPQHFRTSNTLYFLRLFQKSRHIRIVVNFFFPYHGHNPCDRHLGSTSTHLHCAMREMELGGKVDRDWLAKNIAECKFTTIKDLPPIKKHSKVVATLAGIHQYLVFTFPEDEEDSVDCRRLHGGQPTRLKFKRLDQK